MAHFPTLLSLVLVATKTLALNVIKPQLPPCPLKDSSAELVNDEAHPYQKPSGSDIRDTCPGLNTLGNHEYLPRSCITTPAQIVNAPMFIDIRFQRGNDLAVFLTVFIVDGNPLTGLFSIGRKTPLIGPDLPSLLSSVDSTHMHSSKLVKSSNDFGGGILNITSAAAFRVQRVQESIATNPKFTFNAPRYVGAYSETAFPPVFWVDGRKADHHLSLDVALGFFEDGRMPNGFFRTNPSTGFDVLITVIGEIFRFHPIRPGSNQGCVNSYASIRTQQI
ncbi:hypothetical protein M422DRAFT_263767 [Sphaerobolus stellatus SS14]|uniref:Heme haloperoxidase family profile domain-containing protein n=1 Tax=Sphaerobolus stellatus (strain SS14) TaxID=990650 RepID=A0A0C9UH11_SPHS4|nr:hypothetical protein M422DRAFT_263767 [Sphaerobolus stellatus SS14]